MPANDEPALFVTRQIYSAKSVVANFLILNRDESNMYFSVAISLSFPLYHSITAFASIIYLIYLIKLNSNKNLNFFFAFFTICYTNKLNITFEFQRLLIVVI